MPALLTNMAIAPSFSSMDLTIRDNTSSNRDVGAHGDATVTVVFHQGTDLIGLAFPAAMVENDVSSHFSKRSDDSSTDAVVTARDKSDFTSQIACACHQVNKSSLLIHTTVTRRWSRPLIPSSAPRRFDIR